MTGMAGLAAVGGRVLALPQTKPSAVTTKAKGKSLMGFKTKPMDTVRFGFIGVGARGPGHIASVLAMDGTKVVAICDLYKDWAANAAKLVTDAGQPAPAVYVNGPLEYRKLLDRKDIDAVVIATPWETHVPMAIDAMNRGKHVFVEVPAAITLEQCWQLVDTAEKNQVHCMQMENVCYGREELMCLNLVRSGALGELIHGEGAYIHDLRGQMEEVERGTGSWRTVHYQKRNGNLYPTHGLGPVAQYMNINQGDRFDFLSSVSSNSRVRSIYGKQHFPADHKWNKTKFIAGDINTTIIKTVLGKSIMVQWDEQLPRPYNRLNLIQGTKGVWGGFPNRGVLDGLSKSTDTWDEKDGLKPWFDKYEHPLWKKQGQIAQKVGGHGGMDFLMMWRIVYCLRNGLPLDQTVYDAAAWSAVSPLSEWSVAHRSESVDFPDFTRGAWKTTAPLKVFDPPV